MRRCRAFAPSAGKGGFDSLAGERALKSRFGLATLDGLGAPTRAELAAAGGLLAYLDATQKGAGILLDAPRRVSRAAHMAIDAATRDSLELSRSVGGSVAGSLLGEIDRCQTAAGRRLLCEDISAPLTDRSAIEQRLALVAWLHEDAIRRERVRSALKAMPDFARALARLAAGRGSPRDLAVLRDGLSAAAALQARARKASPTGRRCSIACFRGSAATTRWSTGWRARLVESPPIDAARAATSPKAMTPRSTRLRDAASDGRRAIAALESRYRDATGVAVAQDPAQCRARLSRRSLRAARRQTDGAGQRLHPPPDAWPASCASTRRSCTRKRAGWSRLGRTRSPPRPRTPRN